MKVMYRKGDKVNLLIDMYSYAQHCVVESKETIADVMFIERHGNNYRMTLKWRTRKHTIPIKGFNHTKVFEFKEGWTPMCDYYIGHHSRHHHINPKFKVHCYVKNKIE